MTEARSFPEPCGDRRPTDKGITESVRRQLALLHYVLAGSMTAGILFLYLAMSGTFGQRAPIAFLIPVVLSAYFWGLGPGLFSTFLGVLAADYFLMAPLHSFRIANPVDCERLISLLTVGVLTSILSELASSFQSPGGKANWPALSNVSSGNGRRPRRLLGDQKRWWGSSSELKPGEGVVSGRTFFGSRILLTCL